MADLYPNIRMPQYDFSVLGDLPATFEQARLTGVRRSLGDLKLDTPQDIARASEIAFQRGDVETGLKLAQISSQRLTAEAAMKGAEQRGIDMQLFTNYLANRGGGAPPTPISGPVTPQSFELPPVPTAPGPAPATPSWLGTIKPQSALEPSSPSEQIINAAQAGAAPSPAPTQLAGPPTALPAPSQMEPTAPVPFAQPPAQPSMGTRPPTAGFKTENPQVQGALQEAAQLREKISRSIAAGPKYWASPEARADMAQFTDAMKRAGADREDISYYQELARLQGEGKPPITRQDFKNDTSTVGERVGAMEKAYTDYRNRGQAAEDLGNKLVEMRQIMDHPQFSVGNPTFVERAAAGLGRIVGAMEAYGVSVPGGQDLVKSLTTPAALKEAFQSLSNQAVTTALGGLSKSISDADRNFLSAAYPALSQTKEGMELIHKFLTQSANRRKMEAGIAAQYREDNRVRGSAAGMDLEVDKRMEKYAAEHPIIVDESRGPGNERLTPLGAAMNALRIRSNAVGGTVGNPAVAPAQAVPSAPAPAGNRRMYEINGQRFWQYNDGRPDELVK